jgi:uncharacterized membrane protein YccC
MTEHNSSRTLPRTAWKPGQSGNPKGRPREDNPISLAAKKAAPEALKIALTIMRATNSAEATRLAAVNLVLERAYGKPKQELDVTHRRPEELTDDELYSRIEELEREYARALAEAPRDIAAAALASPSGSGAEAGAEELQ